jgi:hypothetical protein
MIAVAGARAAQMFATGDVSVNSEARKFIGLGPRSSIAHKASAFADIGFANK